MLGCGDLYHREQVLAFQFNHLSQWRQVRKKMPRNVCVNVLGKDEHVLARLGSHQFGRFLKSISRSHGILKEVFHFLRICLIYEFEKHWCQTDVKIRLHLWQHLMDFAICLLVYILRPEYVPILSRFHPLGHFWTSKSGLNSRALTLLCVFTPIKCCCAINEGREKADESSKKKEDSIRFACAINKLC